MQQEYQPASIETAAQQWWQDQNTFRALEDSDNEKYYCLAMSLLIFIPHSAN